MTVLHSSVREAFAEQVKSLPPVNDPATTAIRRGRRLRRGRALAAGVVAAVSLAGMVGGVASLQDWLSPEPENRRGAITAVLPPPGPATVVDDSPLLPWRGSALGVEVRLVNRVWTADGQRPQLRSSALVAQAYRTPHGLLYGGTGEIRIRYGEDSADLATGIGAWLPSPDGRRVAFISGDELQVAPLHAGGLGPSVGTEVPSGTTPVAFWGDRVVVAGPVPGTFDVWDPARPYQPAWTDQVVAVYGEVDGDLAVLVGPPGNLCVVVVPADADRLEPEGAGSCRRQVPVSGDGYGWMAPGGGWLAVPAAERLLLVPLFADAESTAPVACPQHTSVAPIWWDEQTLVTADETGVVTCTVAGTVDRLGLPDGLATHWDYVPPLGLKPSAIAARPPK